MNLINKQEIAGLTPLSGMPAEGLATLLMSTLQLNKFNKLYSKASQNPEGEFLNNVLDVLQIKFEFDEAELAKIPSKGAFITVSNHPYGGIDGILLLKILSDLRPDFKVMGNFLLQKIKPIEDKLFGVNPFEHYKDKRPNLKGIREAMAHLADGHPMGIFPAGEVSSFNHNNKVSDKPWATSAIKLIKKAKVPVIPIYFHGHNSLLFHLLGAINPMLRTARLPSEMLNKKNKTIVIRIGSPISVKQQSEFTNIAQYGRYLRARTYALGTPFTVNNFFSSGIKIKGKAKKIVDPQPVESLINEIKLIEATHLLFESGNYQVYCSPAALIPNILNEIGRLREITFRAVGEGTNRSFDLDEYDLYYEHLFIWDNKNNKIAGAYRIGKGKEIIELFGVKGFYISSLFKIRKELNRVLEKSIELGRSFIVEEYQRKTASLFLLWKGILYVLLKNADYRYLIGPVSISNSFSRFSKSIMIGFLQKNYMHPNFAQYVKPRKAFKPDYKNIDRETVLKSLDDNIKRLDNLIEDVNLRHVKVPVLLKKYLKQNAKLLEFNVDPRFNKALDGLIILDLLDIPYSTIQSLSKEMEESSVTNRFIN